VRRHRPRTFLDAGCGAGGVSKLLCGLGLSGSGIDFAPAAVSATARLMAREVQAGRYAVECGDILNGQPARAVDLVVSCMVMEHVADDLAFVRELKRQAAPGGCVAIMVPGRMDAWSFEDETAGHLRRYEADGLRELLLAAGLRDVEVWSVAVPVANLTLRLGARLVQRSSEAAKLGLDQRRRTEASGLRQIAWKTAFPAPFALLLNRWTLWPLLVLQRRFYGSRRGVTLLAFGSRAAGTAEADDSDRPAYARAAAAC
jgi:SAM-dependent methyltransferase